MFLLRSMHFFSIILLIFIQSGVNAMDNAKKSCSQGLVPVFPVQVKRVKELAVLKKPWLHSSAIFTPRTSADIIASHPNNNIVATGSSNGIDIWDMDNGWKVDMGCGGMEPHLRDIAIHPTKDLVAALIFDTDPSGYGADDSLVEIWNVSEGKVRSFKLENVTNLWVVQFHPEHDCIAAQPNYQTVPKYVWDINSGERLSTPVKNWLDKRIAHPAIEQKGKDIHVIKEYKDYTLDQVQLKYALSHWLLIEKPDKKIDSLEKLLSDVAWKCGLDYQHCCVTWKSFPKPMQWGWLKDILEAIQRHGKK